MILEIVPTCIDTDGFTVIAPDTLLIVEQVFAVAIQ